MTRTTRPFSSAALQRLMLWCLLVALPVYGLSGTVVGLLGHAHFHRPAVEAPTDIMTGWAYFTRIGHGPQPQNQRLGALAQHAQSHDHDGLARHHHPGGDESVVVVDGTGPDDGVTGSGNAPGSGLAAQMFVLPDNLAPPAVAAGHGTWWTLAAQPLASHDPDLLDKPPKA